MVEVEEVTLLHHLRTLESAVAEESQSNEVLLYFIDEIHRALEVDDYSAALRFVDELEEFMDYEFCVS